MRHLHIIATLESQGEIRTLIDLHAILPETVKASSALRIIDEGGNESVTRGDLCAEVVRDGRVTAASTYQEGLGHDERHAFFVFVRPDTDVASGSNTTAWSLLLCSSWLNRLITVPY